MPKVLMVKLGFPDTRIQRQQSRASWLQSGGHTRDYVNIAEYWIIRKSCSQEARAKGYGLNAYTLSCNRKQPRTGLVGKRTSKDVVKDLC